MRHDSLGLWWRDEPPPKREPKTKEKRNPPHPFWLEEGYLPPDAGIADPHIMGDGELADAYRRRDQLLFDVESYWNYFIVSFMSFTTGAVVYFQMADDEALPDANKLLWILRNFTVVGFNSLHYDMPILTLALAGKHCQVMKEATNKIIQEGWRASDVLKAYKVKKLQWVDHIDLIEVAPLDGSLKTYGGRLFTPYMQDLPFHPEATLTREQREAVRRYNANDLVHTGFLRHALKEQIELREVMSKEYRQDLRSKSDAQVAEAVIGSQWKAMNGGQYPGKPTIEPGTSYLYRVPEYLVYQSPLLRWVLDVVRTTPFVVAHHGSIEMPKQLDDMELLIGGNVYRMGLGGLHSCENTTAYVASTTHIISDRDVTSFYPQIILNQGLYPEHLGHAFLRIYERIVHRRILAKKDKLVSIADSLKIVVNGTFGKLGSKYSIFYSPDLLVQVTLTGQLVLLMLIERLEMAGFKVISANTDGVVTLCPIDCQTELNSLVAQWEKDTSFPTEETRYEAYYTRDVNNYIAVKEGKKGVKAKGTYLDPYRDPKLAIFKLHKNPVNTVILEAIEYLLTKGTPVEETIRTCQAPHKFTAVRKATGGAVCGDLFLGRVIRWYHATGEQAPIIYAKNGNKIPSSDGAKPMMQLPATMPDDIDYEWYINEAHGALRDIGYELGEVDRSAA